MDIGNRVKALREALGMNQIELAKAVSARGGNLSQAQVSELENGKVKRPRALPELAHVLQTTTEYLLRGKGDPHTPFGRLHNDGNKMFKKPSQTQRGIEYSAFPLILFRSLPSADRAGETMVYQEEAGALSRPKDLAYSKDAFAFTVVDDEAEPKYERRETLLVDPASAPAPGDHCFIVRDPSANPYSGIARRLIRITPEFWITQKFAPGSPEVKLSRSEWRAAWPIFGKYNRR